jgi:protein SCO1/2
MLILGMLLGPATAVARTRWGANYFPNVPLLTQDGKEVHFYDDLLKGKTVAINLIYTHCVDTCPLETARLAQVQKMLGDRVGKDIFFYSISIDPEHDTPSELKAYAAKFHAGPGWLFLTGKKSDLELVYHKLGLYADPSLNRDGHTVDLMIGNEPTGQWMRNNATDNPRFLAMMIGDFLTGWKNSGATTQRSYAQAPDIHLTHKGQYLFATRCAACHTIGHGDGIGPDLLGVTETRDRKWLFRFIQKPEELLSSHDPQATALFNKYKQVQMPNVRLGPEDVDVLISYIAAQNKASVGQATAQQHEGDGSGMRMEDMHH